MDSARLDAHLAEAGADGYLIDADGEEADQRYLSGFDAPDPYLTLYTPDALRLLVSELEYGRARRESPADEVARLSELGYADRRADLGAREARRAVVADFLADAGVDSVAVPRRFPLDTADGLRERGVTVEPDDEGIVTEIRAVKTEEEVANVREAQRANEAAMARAEELIAGAEVEDGTLHHEGEPLTAERVKEAIEVTLLRHGCGLDDTIVAGGEQGADPHDRGSGPLPADEPIVVDVHELPRLSPEGGELEVGNVVTVEPGLYDPAVGGIRVEDFVLVTEDGYENLVDYPKELVVGG